MRILLILLMFFSFLLAGPFYVLFFGHLDLKTSWRVAPRNSTRLAPTPNKYPEAIIQAYAARAYNWRGMFSTHNWIAIKPKNGTTYTVYQVIGWNLFYGYSALVQRDDVPDRSWFGNRPVVILDIRGEKAEKLIPKIEAAVATYPYKEKYITWPGPNSNTFIAYIARSVPELHLVLPPNSVGQDYLPGLTFFARAPSGTGYQVSLFGLFGVTLALDEGIRFNVLGLTLGVSFRPFALVLPGVGYVPAPSELDVNHK